MAVIRFTERPRFRNPWAEFERIRQGFDELSRSMRTGETPYADATVYPPLNMYENTENLIITAELPGIAPGDLDISIEAETLTLQGKRQHSQDDEQLSYHRREIGRGSFSRAIALPTKIDSDNITAKLADGILTVTLAKAAEVKPRKISVITEGEGGRS